ncbi:uncharacterized protein [Antedon mediterranea]|uniref:uncharacterized protein n=1 Tax=Antedon mediterranea TaxID=105859 RepID=UPI003AF5F3AD
MTSTSFQPLDLSNTKSKNQSTGSLGDPLTTHHNHAIFSKFEHKPKFGIQKDKDCSLAWSSTFGTAIPTTSIPRDLLPHYHRGGFIYVPPPPIKADEKPEDSKTAVPPSKLYPHYGIPASDVIPGVDTVPVPRCFCCSDVHESPVVDAKKRRMPKCFSAFAFRNYGIDTLTPPRRVPGETATGILGTASKYPFASVEPFYDHLRTEHRHREAMYRPAKDVCELWKYEGERVGFLPSDTSTLKYTKGADDNRQSPKRITSFVESDDEEMKIKRERIYERDNELKLNLPLKKEEPKSSSILLDSSNDEDPEETDIKTSNEAPEEKNLSEHGDNSVGLQPNRPVRQKSKDSIGPGYIEMIAKAILNSKSKRCMLTDIYKYISTTYSRYRDDTVCWRNIVRHHLSHYECFVKAEHNGHAHYWTINPDVEQDFINGKFHRKRRPNRRKRTISSTKIISNKSPSSLGSVASSLGSVPSPLGSMTSPIANWFPSTFYPYYHDDLTKPYVFVHRQPWLNEDRLRNCYPYLFDANTGKYSVDKSYHR